MAICHSFQRILIQMSMGGVTIGVTLGSQTERWELKGTALHNQSEWPLTEGR